MANDYPHKVISDPAAAEAYCHRMMIAQGLKPDGYGWLPEDPKKELPPVIYYRSYPFPVEDK